MDRLPDNKIGVNPVVDFHIESRAEPLGRDAKIHYGVNVQSTHKKWEGRLAGFLVYMLIFLIILLCVGIWELKRVKPEQRPFLVEYGEK
jgi:tetrahydromethanopterin S-methyltransferase subunit F